MKRIKEFKAVSFVLAGLLMAAIGLTGCGKGNDAKPAVSAPAAAVQKGTEHPAAATNHAAGVPKDHPAH